MKTNLILALAMAGLVGGSLFLSKSKNEAAVSQDADLREQWVNANLVRIKVDNRWEEVPLMPLSDHLCQSGQPMFERYCNDPAPSF